jgi:hypothetical protein
MGIYSNSTQGYINKGLKGTVICEILKNSITCVYFCLIIFSYCFI